MQELINASEAAKAFGYSGTRTFMQAVRRMGIPFYQVNGKRPMFSPQEVGEWLNSRRVSQQGSKEVSTCGS